MEIKYNRTGFSTKSQVYASLKYEDFPKCEVLICREFTGESREQSAKLWVPQVEDHEHVRGLIYSAEQFFGKTVTFILVGLGPKFSRITFDNDVQLTTEAESAELSGGGTLSERLKVRAKDWKEAQQKWNEKLDQMRL